MTDFRFSPRDNRADEIDWHPWEEESFTLAQERDCPILLSISGVWCHWCHVMDEESYSDPQVIEYINENFLPVRVDTDRRPDINARYNMGGWPTTAFLTPKGYLITGATYLPPERFITILREVDRHYQANAEEIEQHTELSEQTSEPIQHSRTEHQQAIPDETDAVIEDVLQQVERCYDEKFGGFGTPPAFEPKFPWLGVLEFLAGNAERQDLSQLQQDMLYHTLDGMLNGEMYDSQRGGFFRYATRRNWASPHYEKMGIDNAVLIETYLRAGQIFQADNWLKAAQKTLNWTENYLTSENGTFYGSQDADEEYYTQAQGGKDRKDTPPVDKTLYTDINARMAGAHMTAYRVLEDDKYLKRGLAALDEGWQLCADEKVGIFHYHDGEQPSVAGLLGDMVEFGLASLDAYGVTADERHFRRAEKMMQSMKTHFQAAEGGFFDSSPDPSQQIGRLRNRRIPLEENCRATLFLHKMALVTQNSQLRSEAEECIKTVAASAASSGMVGALWVAVHREIYDPAPHVQLIIPSDKNQPEAHHDLLRTAARAPQRHAVVHTTVDSDAETAQAYVCQGTHCLSPVTNGTDLQSMLESIRGVIQPPSMPHDNFTTQ